MFSCKQRKFLKLPKEQALHLENDITGYIYICICIVGSDSLAKAVKRQHELITLMRIAITVISSLHVTQVLFTLSIAFCDFFLSPLLKGCKIAFKKEKACSCTLVPRMHYRAQPNKPSPVLQPSPKFHTHGDKQVVSFLS